MPQPALWSDASLDLWRVTTAATPWRNHLEVLQVRHDWPVMNQWLAKDRMQLKSGTHIKWEVMITESGFARFMQPMDSKEYKIKDVMGTLIAPWRLLSSHYVQLVDEMEENASSTTQLQNLLKIRRTDCAIDIANQLEGRAWLAPNSSSDEDNPFGVPYAVVPITGTQVTAGQSGFIGQNASGFNDCYGMDASLAKYARWRSYADVWTNGNANLTEDDITKVTRMLRQLRYKGPINAKEFSSGTFDNLRLYCGQTLLESAEKKARANNDSLGSDLGRFAGQANTRGISWNWEEELDSSSMYSLVALNHDVWVPVFFKGEYMQEVGPVRLPNNHRVMKTDVDNKFNFVCRNRRKCGRIDYVAAG